MRGRFRIGGRRTNSDYRVLVSLIALLKGVQGHEQQPVLEQARHVEDSRRRPGGGRRSAAGTEAPAVYRRRGGRKLYQPATEPSSAALIKGNDRSENIYKSLKLIEDQVLSGIRDKQILIKPNFVQTSVPNWPARMRMQLGHPRTPSRPHYKKQIIIGEAAASKEGTMAGYEHYGYQKLVKDYDVKLVDMNLGAYEYRYTIDEKNAPIPIRICAPMPIPTCISFPPQS